MKDELVRRGRQYATPQEWVEFARIYRLAFGDEIRAYQREYSKREIYKITKRKWAESNRDKLCEKAKRYREAHPDKINAARRIKSKLRYKNDISFRIKSNLSSRMRYALSGAKRISSSRSALGCSIENFRLYIESKFESGMSWENFGRGGWEIDHIMPCAIFDLSKPEHQKRCFHFSNMQPMWGSDNRKKAVKVVTSQFVLL